MGDVVNYKCSCGLKGQALSGGGAEAAGLSYYCKKCECIHTVLKPYDDFDLDEIEASWKAEAKGLPAPAIKENIDPVEALLLKCGASNLSLIDFPEKSQKMTCPHCRKKVLDIEIAGCWD